MGAAPRTRANQRQLDLDLAKYLTQLSTTPDETLLGKLQDALETLLSERSHPMIVALTSQREHLSRVRDLIGHELELRQTKKRAVKVENDETCSKRRRRILNQDPDSAVESSDNEPHPVNPEAIDTNHTSADLDTSGNFEPEKGLYVEYSAGSSVFDDATISKPTSASPNQVNATETESTKANQDYSASSVAQTNAKEAAQEPTDPQIARTAAVSENTSIANQAVARSDHKNVSDKTLSQTETIPNNTRYVTNPKSEFVSTQSLPAHTFYVFQEGDEKNEDEEAYKRRLGVVSYPKEDLSTLTAGPVPMDDYTRAKPLNQVQFNTYATFLEPYFRPLTEEDLQFLQQPRSGSASEAINLKTGKKLSPYIIPPLGPHYLQNWATQDAELIGDEMNPVARKANETQVTELMKQYDAAGSINDINDQSLEGSSLSLGPLTERLIAALVPEAADNKEATGVESPSMAIKAEPITPALSHTGTASPQRSPAAAFAIMEDSPTVIAPNNSHSATPAVTPSSTARLSRASPVVEISTNDQSTSNNTSANTSRTTSVAPGIDFSSNSEITNSLQTVGYLATTLKDAQQSPVITDFVELENHIRREFQKVGVLDFGSLHDFDQFKTDFRLAVTHPRDELVDLDQPAIDWVNGAEDDEICRELRFLQSKLRQVSARNTVYKERLQPVVQEQLSWQEYQSILQDLDKQVDQAYQKRQKMPSSKQKKKKSTSMDSPHDSNAGTPLGGGPCTPDYTKYTVDVRPTIKALIDKRERWVGRIGPLFRPAHEMMREYEIPKFDDLESQALINSSTKHDGIV